MYIYTVYTKRFKGYCPLPQLNVNEKQCYKCLLSRAWKICSDEEYFNEEINFIKKILSANGYPLNFLNSCIHKFLKSKYSTKVKDVNYGPKLKDVYMSLPH